jgi:carboxymethylenebutenolidase
LDFLAQQPEVRSKEIGTTGYCMGGGLSLSAAGNFPDRVVAAASYHGGNLATESPNSPHRLADRIRARVYVAGAVEDASFPDAQKQRLIAALAQASVDHRVETYEGAHHGWVPPDSAVHDPAAAERHWTTLIALFDAKLKKA